MKFIKTLLVMLLFIGSASQAAEWVDVAASETNVFSILAGSIEMLESSSGIKVIASVGRSVEKATNKELLFRWYVPEMYCKEKEGKLVITNIESTTGTYSDFIAGSGTVASVIAEALCNVASSPAGPTKPKKLITI